MTFGAFVFGSLMMVTGFFAVWKTNWFLETFGDIGSLFNMYDKPWISWKTIGVFLLFVGFMIAFGLFQIFFRVVFGRLFFFGGV